MPTYNGVKPQLEVRPSRYSTTQHRDDNAFYNEKVGGKIESLSQSLTWMLGNYNSMTSICSLEGFYAKNKAEASHLLKPESGGQYTTDVMGSMWKTAEVAFTPSVLTPETLGVGGGLFQICFKDAVLKRTQIVTTPRGMYVRVESEPRFKNGYYEYDFQLVAVRKQAFMPVSEVQAGTLWVALFSATSDEESTGSGSDVMYPGKIRNQIGHLQKKATWGNKKNLDKMMDFTINIDGKSIKSWMSWFLWNFEEQWAFEKEHMYWYSRYNRNANGEITLKDTVTNQVVPLGSGLLEQIPNTSSYTKLSANSLLDKLTTAYFGQYDTDNMSITLHTGTGGMREFNDMIDREFGKRATLLNIATDSDKFLSGSGHNLAVGGYFDQIHLIDGYVIKVKKNPLFDKGRVAQGSVYHKGLPSESYRMVFLDDSDVEGEPNITFVHDGQVGFQHMCTAGLTDMPRDLRCANVGSVTDTAAPFRSSENTQGMYVRKQSFGVNLRRANRSFMMELALS